jgi:hypothetical protein
MESFILSSQRTPSMPAVVLLSTQRRAVVGAQRQALPSSSVCDSDFTPT